MSLRPKLASALGAVALFASLTFAALAIPSFVSAATCPNETIRESQTSEALPLGTTGLPDCMALEMLSAPKKFGQEATELGAFSPDGTRALYKSKAALADTEGLKSFIGDNYVALLGAGGWETQATSPPAEAELKVGGDNYGGPFAFTADLEAWALFGSTKPEQFSGEGQFFTGGLDDSFEPLSPPLLLINDTGDSIKDEVASIGPTGTAADLSAAVFRTISQGSAYLPGDPRSDGTGTNNNSYLAFIDEDGQPALELLARDGDGGEVYGGRCGTRLGNGGMNQGAISPDGSRVYFSTRPGQPFDEGTGEGPPCDTANPLRVMVRDEAPGGPSVAPLFTGGTGTGDDLFQGASLDSSKVFLATPRKLATSDQDTTAEACSADVGTSKGCDLYLYDSSLPESERLIQVSAGGTGDPDPGKVANVLTATVAISPDGSHVYFVAQGVLTNTANPQGETATAGKPNLYLYERDAEHPSGETSFIGILAEGDKTELWGAARSFANGAYAVPLTGGPQGGDGHILFLTSQAALTPEADDGDLADIFRYDADADALECATCDPALPAEDMVAGPNEVSGPPSSDFEVRGRWASEDGETMTFVTAPPALVSGTPYLWKEGQLVELPGEVKVKNPLQRPIVSMDGELAGFTTTEALLPIDGDTARDVYLVRANGGFPNPVPPTICDPLSEGSCQGAPSGGSAAPGIATATFSGPGNQKAKQKPRCRKGKVRRRGRCVKQKRRQAKGTSKRTSEGRGGSR